MKTLDTYIGIQPFTVEVDDSPQLKALAAKARELRTLPFDEKLAAVKVLALEAMVNAYEGAQKDPDPARQNGFANIVYNVHPLSYALEVQAGCCRYQGALFFVLGYEADLGDQHFIEAAPVGPGVNSVFNVVMHQGTKHTVSIFTESLKDKSLDYTVTNPRVFEQAFAELPGYSFYSYHRTLSGLVILENPNKHVRMLGGK
ncbi:hypothetical protein HZB01_01385 [Candidatus Woesearchaeota archaeon]|nr:hypothetical protein [Candidatus Woesearchaeota archaeon]